MQATTDNTNADRTESNSRSRQDSRIGEYPARSNDHLKTTGVGGVAYKGKTLVYSPDHSAVFHADRDCPELAEVEVARKLPLDHVLSTEGTPSRPCSRCTCDMATSIRVAIEHDGLDPEEAIYE